MESLIAAMISHPTSVAVQEACCGTMKSLVVNPSNRDKAVRLGAVDATVYALNRHVAVAGVAEEGCGALCNLTIDAKKRKVSLAVPHGATSVVAAMRCHLANLEVQEAGCAALWSLAEADSRNPGLAVESGAADAVAAAMQAHPRNIPVQAVGVAALKCFCELGNSGAVAAAGGLEAVMQSLRVHGTVAPVQEAGLEALMLMGTSHPLVLKTAREGGAEEICLAAVHTRFPTHDAIQRIGQQALRLFSLGD